MKKIFWPEQKGNLISTPHRSVKFDKDGYALTDDITGNFLSNFKTCKVTDSDAPDEESEIIPVQEENTDNITDEDLIIQQELNKNLQNN